MKSFKVLILFLCLCCAAQATYLGSYLYVDGTLASGNNDGGADNADPSDPTQATNWTDAYQNVAGLQSAFDDGGFSITFTSGSTEPAIGDTITGLTSGATLRLHTIIETNSDWVGGNAAGTMYGSQLTGTFQAENCHVDGAGDDLTCAGAQAIDGNLTIFVRNTFTITVTIDKDANQQPLPYWWRVVGCSGTSGPVANGSYVLCDSGATDLVGTPIFLIAIDFCSMSGIHAKDPGGASTPSASEYCFRGTGDSLVLENCFAEGGYYGISTTQGAKLLNCGTIDCLVRGASIGNGSTVMGGHYEWGSETDATVIHAFGNGVTVLDAVIEGGARGIDFLGATGGNVINCSITGQSVASVEGSTATAGIFVINSILDVADTANDLAIKIDAGRVWENNNRTDADDYTLSGFLDWSSSVENLTFTNTDPFVSISGDNFRLNRGQTQADVAFGGGFTLFWNSSTVTIPMFISAAIGYDLPEIANVESNDTVYGTTGTSAGGGGYYAGNKTSNKQN